jgi:hypothetical protein
MAKKVIVELPHMGAFCGSHCAIFLDEEKKRIYCDCTGGFPQCDMSQWGWGMTSYCPLYGFHFSLEKEKEKIEKYISYLKEYKILRSSVINQIKIEIETLEGAQPAE